MKRAAFGALLSHWWRHPIQLLTLVTGLALATGLWSAVQAINGEARASYAKAAAQVGGAQSQSLTPTNGFIPLSRYVMLRRSGWQLAPVLEGRWQLVNGSVKLIGVDFLNHPSIPQDNSANSSGTPLPLDTLGPTGRLFTHPDTVVQLNGQPNLPPITLTNDLPLGIVLTDIALAERLLQQTGQLSRLIILPDQPIGLKPLKMLAPELKQQFSGDAQITRLTDSFHLNLTAFGLLSFAVGLFIVHGTIGLGIEQRRGLFRTLRAMGIPLRLLTVLLLSELILIAIFAGGMGLLLGYLIAAALLPDVSATLDGLYGATVDGSLNLRLNWILSGLGMAVFGTMIASIHAISNTYKMPLLLAPGIHVWAMAANRRHQAMAAFGAGLIVVGVIVVLIFDGLIAGFTLLAGLMLGGALILPLFLMWLLSAGAHFARSALSEWIWADMRAQLPGISLALMALLLALATNIGVGTMVSSFRLTFLGWLDQRLSAELYVTIKDESQAEDLVAWLDQRGVTTLPIRWKDTSYEGEALRVYGVVDDDTYRSNWPILSAYPDAWDQIADGKAVLINEQLARRQNLSQGSLLSISQDWQPLVVGVYSDYGNPNGQALVSLPVLLQHSNNIPNRQFGLRLPPQSVQPLMNELYEAFGNTGISVTDQSEIKARSLAVFDRTFVVTSALNLLTLGVAGFAILTSLLTLWNMRLPQLAPVWALGMTRRKLAWLELLRSVALAMLTAILALPLGLVLAWALLSIINVEAFGWKLPMYLFPLDWIRLLTLALIAAAVAAAIPARRLAMTKPSDLLKVFANER